MVPDKDSLAADLISQVCDGEFVGERHRFAVDWAWTMKC
jgi:hypothetical protein